MKEKLKKLFKGLGYTVLGGFLFILCFFLLGKISGQYTFNHKYSIAMPTILGKFEVKNDYIQIWGLNKIIDDEIANLLITEFTCIPSLKHCAENRVGITSWANEVIIAPYHYEYYIKFADNNKILFEENKNSYGEINLNTKKLIFTQKNAGFEGNLTRKIEVITDNKEIEKLEKKIIRKYLKKEWFKW